MKTMKKNYFIALLALICNFAFAQIEQVTYRGAFAPAPTAMWTDSWTNYDPQNKVYPNATVVISTDITENTTWTVGSTYSLSGIIYVKNGAVLTIQPGVVVKGAGAGAALVITKGAKINAIGTAANPIVFTSNNAVGSRTKGDWGGLILLGKASLNVNNGVNNIEGITASADTQFGGGTTPDNADNSGTLKYVRIEFGGYVYNTNAEINGLTMGAVGSGTTIDYVQVSFTNDDAFEWFGGSVNCKHLVSFRNLDDDFDTDNGYSGNVQYALAIRDPQMADAPAVSTSEGFESDNNAAGTDAAIATSGIFTNCTLIGPSYRVSSLPNGGTLASGYKRALRIRRASQLKIFNSLFMDFQEGLHIDGVRCENNAVAGTLAFGNNILAGMVTKPLQVSSPGTITVGNNPAFNMTDWYTANANSTVASSSGLLTAPYNASSALTYTGLDYRPAVGSIVETGASFSNTAFTGNLIAVVAPVAPIEYTSYRGAFAPAPTAMWTDRWTNYDPQNAVYSATGITVSGEITTNTTWTTGKTYLLQGITYVKNGATLTIQPGVTIRGAGAGSALVITKGAKINAVGTATSPIVFTSNKPVGERAKGDWGGIILLGKASFNINNGVNNIEGITATDDTQFGGGLIPDDNDNSGTLKYVRIEFGGYVYNTNAEINGLTMGGVGRGTTIDYVQVSFTNDDAFEWFGGSVNCKHLVSYRNLDDDFDADNGFSGKVQYALAIRDPQIADVPAVSTSEGFEVDNNASGSAVSPYTNAIFTNCTLIGPSYRVSTLPNGGTLASGYKRAARLRRASQISIYNSIFMDFQEGLHIDGVASETHALNGDLKFKNNILAGIVTTSKVLQVTSPGTITAGINPSFNMTTWYAANGNTTQTLSAGLLTLPYNTTSATTYTGLDYRPATGSAALSNSNFDGLVAKVAPIVVSPINICKSSVASALTATLNGVGAVSFKWYIAATGGTALTAAPVPATTAVGTKKYYVSQVYGDNSESPRKELVVNVTPILVTPGTITGIATRGALVGTTTTATYSIAAVTDAVSYVWTVPTGVNIVEGQGTTTVTVNFADVTSGAGAIGNIGVAAVNAAGCNSLVKNLALTKALPKAPTAIKMTDALLPVPTTGILTAVTSFAKYMGTTTTLKLTATVSVDASSYVWELPTGVNIVSGATDVQGVITSTSNEIEVNFNDVTSASTLTSVSTNVLRIGVSAKNGTGLSVVNNSLLIDPITSSTARLLTLKALLPAAPSAIKLTDGTSTVAITDVSKFIGKTTVFTLTATASALASSYTWTLPAGVNQLSGTNTNVITVNFADVASGVTALPIGVKAVNGIGSSSTVNAAPNEASTSRILKLTALAPTAVTAITNATVLVPTVGASGDVTQSYTMTASAKANTYFITVPTGCTVTTEGNTETAGTTLETANLTFTVTYPNTYVSTTTAPKRISIVAKNGVGNSAEKLFVIKSTTATSGISENDEATVSIVSRTEMYPNPASDILNIDVIANSNGTLDMTIFAFDGTKVSETKSLKIELGTNSFTENVSKLNKGIYLVKITNSSSNEVITKRLMVN